MKVSSIIRDSLWSEAKWIGASYSYQPGRPPMLALMFASINASRKIFEAWRERFGENDIEDHIKVTVAKGINEDKPAISDASEEDVPVLKLLDRKKPK